MAVLNGITFTGSMGDISGYRMHGSDKTFARRKGGASKKMIKTSPRFAIPRLNMSEFAGCSTMGKKLRLMLTPVKRLADHNISSPINKLLKVVQKQDKINPLGQRSISLSQYTQVLEGFSLNKSNPFDSLIRNPLAVSFLQEKNVVRVDIPELMHEINFFPHRKHPLFNITVVVGMVPDFAFNESTGLFEPPSWYQDFQVQYASTPWHATMEGSPATTLEVNFKHDMSLPPDASYSLMVSVGIQFGNLYGDGIIEPVKRAGAAKILALRANSTNSMVTTFTPNDHAPAPVKETTPIIQVTQASAPELKAEQADSNRSDMLVGNVNTTAAGIMFVYSLQRETGEGYQYKYEVVDANQGAGASSQEDSESQEKSESPEVRKTESRREVPNAIPPSYTEASAGRQRVQRRRKGSERKVQCTNDNAQVRTLTCTNDNTLTPISLTLGKSYNSDIPRFTNESITTSVASMTLTYTRKHVQT